MKRWMFYALLLLISIGSCTEPNEQSNTYRVIGYVAGWKDNWTTKKINAEKLTHINYAFAEIENNRISGINESDSLNFLVLDSLKRKNPELKLLISVGGWGGSDNFSDAALTEESRKTFAESAVAFMKKHRLDGVDLDWEYPGQQGDRNVYRIADRGNFTLMLKEMRRKLDEQSQKDGRTGKDAYLLTIAAGASHSYLWYTELSKAHQYLDFINIMTYDFHTGSSPVAGHHTNLFPSDHTNFTGSSTSASVDMFLGEGIPPEKLVVGVAFYGRGWTKVEAAGNGLYQSTSGEHISLSYDSLSARYINKQGYRRFWDEQAKAPFLWNENTNTFLTYDDEESLRHTVAYIKSKNLGGAMFWEYSSDMGNRLLDILSTELIPN